MHWINCPCLYLGLSTLMSTLMFHTMNSKYNLECKWKQQSFENLKHNKLLLFLYTSISRKTHLFICSVSILHFPSLPFSLEVWIKSSTPLSPIRFFFRIFLFQLNISSSFLSLCYISSFPPLSLHLLFLSPYLYPPTSSGFQPLKEEKSYLPSSRALSSILLR